MGKRARKRKTTPLDYLESVMNDSTLDIPTRLRAAISAAQYRHAKRAHGGKKEEQAKAAEAAVGGKFAPAAAPKLVVSND